MTTKDALGLAIITLQKESRSKEKDEAIKLLAQLQKRDFISKWTQETIIAALDNWRDINGKPPTATNLIEPGMPGSNIIQKYFGMSAKAFLRMRYPKNNNSTPPKNKYGFMSEDDWVTCFREQFLKHCNDEGFSSKTYNILKDKNTPLWTTIARHCGTSKWSKLMELAKVKYPGQIEQCKPGALHIASVKSPWLERLEDAVAKREILDRQLIESMERNTAHRKSR